MNQIFETWSNRTSYDGKQIMQKPHDFTHATAEHRRDKMIESLSESFGRVGLNCLHKPKLKNGQHWEQYDLFLANANTLVIACPITWSSEKQLRDYDNPIELAKALDIDVIQACIDGFKFVDYHWYNARYDEVKKEDIQQEAALTEDDKLKIRFGLPG